MTSTRIRPAILVATTVMVVVFALPVTSAQAGEFTGEADGDSVVLRGSIHPPEMTAGARATQGHSGPIHTCLLRDSSRFRCDSTDPATDDSTDPGADLWTIGTSPVTGTRPASTTLAGAVATEFRRIPLTPSPIVVQPASGWTLVNLETIVLTSSESQTHATTVLGTAVNVRATPTLYTWDFGDDSPALLTTDAGSPWPHQSVTHTYLSTGMRTIRLTTEWAGEFQVRGSSTWQPITGTATTSETAPPLDVRRASNTLVATHTAYR